MNKSEFAQQLAERTELSKAAATRSLDGILDTLTEVMVDRDEVSFAGWGKFSAQRRKGREAHDPRDASRTIHVPAAYVPKFKPGTALKRELAGLSPQGQSDGEAAATRSAQPDDGAGARADSHSATNGDGPPAGTWRPLAQRRK